MGRLAPPQNSNYCWFLDIRLTDSGRCLIAVNFKAISRRKRFCARFTLHSISKVGFKIHFVRSMFYAKEEKANFKLENESQPNVRHFLTDGMYKVTNRKPYVNVISENSVAPTGRCEISPHRCKRRSSFCERNGYDKSTLSYEKELPNRRVVAKVR